MASTTGTTYSASGLASNIDWTQIIDSMMKLQQGPLDALRTQQSALQTQISSLGTLASRLATLDTASSDLAASGLLAVSASSGAVGFSVQTAPGTTSGSYSLQVGSLATVAKARSDRFDSKDSEVRSGTLELTVMGKQPPYSVRLKPGSSLADAATAINASGAPVIATVIDNGSGAYLTLTNRDTGYPIDLTSDDALKVVETSDAGTAPPLGLALTQRPTNAAFELDGLTFIRTTNVVTDALPGVTLTLKAKTSAPEDLLLDNDSSGTASRLQKFIDAYNAVLALVQRQLNVSAGSDRSSSLAGDSNVRNLQQRLQSVLVSRVGTGTVRSLADLGVKTNRDGSLSLDTNSLTAAIARDPASVDALFSTATTGIAAQMSALVKGYTDPYSGLLTQRTTSLQKRIKDLDDSATKMQTRIDTMKQTLIDQFTAMENTISGLKATGQYLDQLSAMNSRSSS